MKKEKEILRGITDFITGEVIPIYEGDKISITRRETIDYLKSTIEINKNKEFVMSFNIPFRTLAKLNLKSNEYDILMVMLSFLGWGYYYSGYAVKIQNRKPYDFMNGEDIRKYTNCDKPTFSKAIKSLEKKEIIKIEKAKVGRGNNFIINPFIMTHDKRVPIRIFKMFESSIFNYTNQTSQLSSSEIHDKIREEKDTN